MVDHPGSNLHKPPDYRVYGWPDALPPERGIPDHVEQIVTQTSDEKPCLIRCEAMAARFVQPEGVFPFFYPVLNLTPAFVN